jgi:hypothetical protein
VSYRGTLGQTVLAESTSKSSICRNIESALRTVPHTKAVISRISRQNSKIQEHFAQEHLAL